MSKLALDNFNENMKNGIHKDKIIERILIKQAICHAVYDLSTGFKTGESFIIKLNYKFHFQMTYDEIENFLMLTDMSETIFPEVGARIFQKYIVLEAVGKSIAENDNNCIIGGVFLDYTVIQNNVYMYKCYSLNGEDIKVKIVYKNFLFAEIDLFKDLGV